MSADAARRRLFREAGHANWSGIPGNQLHMITGVLFGQLGRFLLLGGQQGLFFRFSVRFFALGHVDELLVKGTDHA
jgi:hypothetical protein